MRILERRPQAGLLGLITVLLLMLAAITAACSSDGDSDTEQVLAANEAPPTEQALTQPRPTSIAPRLRRVSQDTMFVPIVEDPPTSLGFAQLLEGRGQLYYEVYGEGEPLLLIPGLSANHLSWAEQVGRFSETFQVIIYDPRGTGQSSPIEPDYNTADMADDASGLLDALGLGAVHVYGASMGGMIAQEFAIRHPEHVASLILGGTTPGGPSSVSAKGWALTVFLGAADPEGQGRSILDVLYSPEFLRDHPDRIAQGLGLIGDYPITRIEVIAAQLIALTGHNVYDRLPAIDVPTLVLHGADDPLIPVENGRLIADQIPGAELLIFEGTRHSYRTEVAEADEAVLEFLSALISVGGDE